MSWGWIRLYIFLKFKANFLKLNIVSIFEG